MRPLSSRRARLWSLGLAAVALLGLAACEDPYVPPPEPAGARACDPLAVASPPLALASLIAAGRSASGTVYAIDETPPPSLGTAGERRVFVSAGDALERRRVTFARESDAELLVSAGDAADLQVKVERTGFDGPVTRMGVFLGPLGDEATTFNLDFEGETLDLLAADELAAFRVVDLPPVDVLYAASASDGRRLVVLHPTGVITTESLRVFFGAPERMVQRTVLSAAFTTHTTVVFDLDGEQVVATLTSWQSNALAGAARLEAGSATLATLTPLPGSPGEVVAGAGGPPPKTPAATFTAGLSFLCF